MYRDRPRTLNELNTAITAYIRNVSQADLQKVFANEIKRVQACIDARGHHFQNSSTFCKCTATFRTHCRYACNSVERLCFFNRFWGILACPVGANEIVCDMYNPYPTAFPYGNGMVLHFYQQQESSTTKTVHKVINKGLKTYV